MADHSAQTIKLDNIGSATSRRESNNYRQRNRVTASKLTHIVLVPTAVRSIDRRPR